MKKGLSPVKYTQKSKTLSKKSSRAKTEGGAAKGGYVLIKDSKAAEQRRDRLSMKLYQLIPSRQKYIINLKNLFSQRLQQVHSLSNGDQRIFDIIKQFYAQNLTMTQNQWIAITEQNNNFYQQLLLFQDNSSIMEKPLTEKKEKVKKSSKKL